MFEYATRNKLRFNYHGMLTVEDLWDLSVESLNEIYKNLNKHLKEESEESLLDEKVNPDKELITVSIDIVKHIVSVKLEKQNAQRMAAERSIQKQKILKIMAKKQDSELQEKSLDELSQMLDKLD